MHLAELCEHLLPSFPPSVQKDIKTAVGYLAKALDCSDPQHCPLELYTQPLASLYGHIETYQLAQSKGPHTIRNIKNAISRLLRETERQQLFTPVDLPLVPQHSRWTRPPRHGAESAAHHGTSLPYRNWPPALQESFTAFQTWATSPLVPGRDASLRKRPVTVDDYQRGFENYFGFLVHVQDIPCLTFDQLFDFELVSAYVHWHVNEIHHRTTKNIHQFLMRLFALTRQYRPDPDLRARLVALKKTLPTPAPVYNKDDAWVSLATLEEIGHMLWPRKHPHEISTGHSAHPGLNSAVRASLSLMFRLWTYRPYRQRNIREMALGTNLRKDNGTWHITFNGEQLKIAVKRGRPNTFDLPFPQALVPHLEEYLSVWRPLLIKKAGEPLSNVFITRQGGAYTVGGLRCATSQIVYRYTGKHWHPHIIRSVWATEWIRKTHGDFYTAAVMLNDRLETVIANYAHLLEEDVAEKADRIIEERNGQGK